MSRALHLTAGDIYIKGTAFAHPSSADPSLKCCRRVNISGCGCVMGNHYVSQMMEPSGSLATVFIESQLFCDDDQPWVTVRQNRWLNINCSVAFYLLSAV